MKKIILWVFLMALAAHFLHEQYMQEKVVYGQSFKIDSINSVFVYANDSLSRREIAGVEELISQYSSDSILVTDSLVVLRNKLGLKLFFLRPNTSDLPLPQWQRKKLGASYPIKTQWFPIKK